MAQKIASSDSSYGATMVLKTATAHLAATKEAETWASFAKNHYSRYIETNDGLYGGISDSQLRNAFDTATFGSALVDAVTIIRGTSEWYLTTTCHHGRICHAYDSFQ